MTTKYNDFCFNIIDARLFFLITILQKGQLHLKKANTTISSEEGASLPGPFCIIKWGSTHSVQLHPLAVWEVKSFEQMVGINTEASDLFFRETVFDLTGKRH